MRRVEDKMDKSELVKKCHRVILELPPDIAENQRPNRIKMVEMMHDCEELYKVDKSVKKLHDLMSAKYHYFDEGYIDPRTPEELEKELEEAFNESLR